MQLNARVLLLCPKALNYGPVLADRETLRKNLLTIQRAIDDGVQISFTFNGYDKDKKLVGHADEQIFEINRADFPANTVYMRISGNMLNKIIQYQINKKVFSKN